MKWDGDYPHLDYGDIKEEYIPHRNQWSYHAKVKLNEFGDYILLKWSDERIDCLIDVIQDFQIFMLIRYHGLKNGYKGDDIEEMLKHAIEYRGKVNGIND